MDSQCITWCHLIVAFNYYGIMCQWNYYGIIMDSWTHHGTVMELSWTWHGIVMKLLIIELSCNYHCSIVLLVLQRFRLCFKPCQFLLASSPIALGEPQQEQEQSESLNIRSS